MKKHLGLGILCHGMLLLACQAQAGGDTWLPRWNYRRTLSVQAAGVDADLTNFPVLVRLHDANFEFLAVCEDGRDVRFALPDGTLLDYDRERHDAVARQGVYWVRLPLVSAASNTTFHLYYGHPAADDGADSHAVWIADYVGVWHLNDANGTTHYDASSNGLHGVVGKAPLDGEGVPGMIGGAVRMFADNIDQYIITERVTMDTTRGLSLSAWANPRSYDIATTLGIPVINIGGANWHPYYTAFLTYRSAGALRERLIGSCGVTTSEGGVAFNKTVSGFTTGTWHHVAATFYYHESNEATNTTLKLYINGEKAAEEQVAGYALRNPLGPRPIGIGARTHDSYPNTEPRLTFDGMMDEARVATVVRSEAWMRASYLNQKAEDELLQIGGLMLKPTGMYLFVR